MNSPLFFYPFTQLVTIPTLTFFMNVSFFIKMLEHAANFLINPKRY